MIGQPQSIALLTESYIPVSHPDSNTNMFESCEPRNLIAREEIPDNSRLARIVTDNQPALPSFANSVHGDNLYSVLMALKSSLDGESVVVQRYNCRPLSEEE